MTRKEWLQLVIPALEATLKVIRKTKGYGCDACNTACHAKEITDEQCREVKRVIQASLGSYPFFHWWLRDHGTDEYGWFTTEEEHKYRVVWFKQMIRDYKEMLANEP